MLADTMMPEAFEHGGSYVGLVTTAGFGLAFAITALEWYWQELESALSLVRAPGDRASPFLREAHRITLAG